MMNSRFKKVFFLCGMLISVQAFAEWTYITKYDENKFYIDKASIKKQGDIVKFWLRTEFEKHPLNALSSLLVHEVNCKKRLIKTLYIEGYDQHNLNGNILASGYITENDPTGSFEKLTNNTPEDLELNFVCK